VGAVAHAGIAIGGVLVITAAVAYFQCCRKKKMAVNVVINTDKKPPVAGSVLDPTKQERPCVRVVWRCRND
jgi:hypothetical protein